MPRTDPVTEIDARYSDEGAAPTPWSEGRDRLEAAELYWLTTIRPDGRLHATPLIGVWAKDALYFCTGPDEQKAKNLARDRHCLLTTGSNALKEGFDLIVEGEAVKVDDDAVLKGIAEAYEAKYGSDWHFDVRDGAFHHGPGEAWVFEVAPSAVYGFGKGPYSHTRWRF
jgi:hypothetical protein